MRKKMTNQERAKIFAPFDALKGFKEALKEEEIIRVSKVTLSEDQEEMINNILKKLEKGMMIEIVYYEAEEGHYLKLKGVFIKIDEINKTIFVVKKRILIANIIDIKIVSVSLDF